MAKKSTSRKKSISSRAGSGKRKASSLKHKGLVVEASLAATRFRSATGKKHAVVEHLPEAPTFVKAKRIHPRRYLPWIAEGEETQLQIAAHAFAPQAKIEAVAAAPADN